MRLGCRRDRHCLELDVAKYYHEAIQANNATSELHLIPLDRHKCDSGPALRSMDHMMGLAEMMEPLVRCLMAAL